jgi:aspartyl-tRNA synthetase
MAFVGREEVMGVIERLVKGIWNLVVPRSVDTRRAFLRMTYYDAMLKVVC